ncbi:MAG: hypothetical protein WD845_13705 [Pirellulales bacterium]
MNGNLLKRFALALGVMAWLGIASIAVALEPKPAPTDEASPATQAAPEPVAAPSAESNTIDPGTRPPLPKALRKPTAPAEEKPAAATEKSRKSLIAPPGLLSQAPSIVPYSPPGLGKLNLNSPSTTIEQIRRLPGVGETWAPRILAGRPYRTFGDMARDGIPYTTIDALSRAVDLGPKQ